MLYGFFMIPILPGPHRIKIWSLESSVKTHSQEPQTCLHHAEELGYNNKVYQPALLCPLSTYYLIFRRCDRKKGLKKKCRLYSGIGKDKWLCDLAIINTCRYIFTQVVGSNIVSGVISYFAICNRRCNRYARGRDWKNSVKKKSAVTKCDS